MSTLPSVCTTFDASTCSQIRSTIGVSSSAWAQFRDEEPGGTELGEARVQRWKAGVIVTAVGGPCRGLVGYVPVPIDWPEQEVRIVEEEFPRQAKVIYQTVDDTVKMMVVRIPMLQGGTTVEATVTYEVRRSAILPPDDTRPFRLDMKSWFLSHFGPPTHCSRRGIPTFRSPDTMVPCGSCR